MSEKPPDFAVMRAVEILANIHERQYTKSNVPPPPLDRPVILFNETCSFELGRTRQEMVQAQLGIGFPYPTKGWHTYAVAGENNTRQLLSVFYKNQDVIAAELYLPKSDRAAGLEPRNIGTFRFVPGEVRVGMPITSMPEIFTPASAAGPIVYDCAFEARFEGGLAYAMGKQGIIERLALYAQKA